MSVEDILTGSTPEELKEHLRLMVKLLKERANTVGMYPTEIWITQSLYELLEKINSGKYITKEKDEQETDKSL